MKIQFQAARNLLLVLLTLTAIAIGPGCNAGGPDDLAGPTDTVMIMKEIPQQGLDGALAVPVAPADTVDRLRPEVDDLICLETPDPFYAISLAYEAFPQLTDEQVINILAASPQPEKPSDRAGARTDPGQDDQAA